MNALPLVLCTVRIYIIIIIPGLGGHLNTEGESQEERRGREVEEEEREEEKGIDKKRKYTVILFSQYCRYI